jgi:hypothetical protein
MASATRKTVEKVVKEVQSVTLELTAEEAEWLKGYVGACTNVEKAAPIYRALNAPSEADDRPIQVGDKVRVTAAPRHNREYLHRIGRLKSFDVTDVSLPFLVTFSDDDWAWVESVERVND